MKQLPLQEGDRGSGGRVRRSSFAETSHALPCMGNGGWFQAATNKHRLSYLKQIQVAHLPVSLLLLPGSTTSYQLKANNSELEKATGTCLL